MVLYPLDHKPVVFVHRMVLYSTHLTSISSIHWWTTIHSGNLSDYLNMTAANWSRPGMYPGFSLFYWVKVMTVIQTDERPCGHTVFWCMIFYHTCRIIAQKEKKKLNWNWQSGKHCCRGCRVTLHVHVHGCLDNTTEFSREMLESFWHGEALRKKFPLQSCIQGVKPAAVKPYTCIPAIGLRPSDHRI